MHKILDKRSKMIYLDDTCDSIQTPDGFKDVTLLPHQGVAVKAMLDLEDNRFVTTFSISDKYYENKAFLETNSLVLSEPYGSGKTYEILALVLSRKIPRAIPELSVINTSVNDTYPNCEIRKKFVGPNMLLSPNLIVVGTSVLLQWEKVIKNNTYLRLFTIGDYYSLKAFYGIYKNNRVNDYDIVLLKNGYVTGNFLLDGESAEDMSQQRILINVIGKMTKYNCWSRVIYDDFDTINIPPASRKINALFTIYVSATKKILYKEPNYKNHKYASVYDLLETNMLLCEVQSDNNLFNLCNISNNIDFVEASVNIPMAKKYKYVYSNPDDNYIKLLGVMTENEANDLAEMLNGDAISTAASCLGINTNSVADIFEKFLGDKYKDRINSVDIMDCIKRALNQLANAQVHPEGKNYSDAALNEFRSQLKKKKDIEIHYYSQSLFNMLNELLAEYKEIYTKCSIAIDRVIANVKEGECQVCCLGLEDIDVFIVKCCGIILCAECGIKGNQIKKIYCYRSKSWKVGGKCANCRANVDPKTDMIYLDQSFNLEKLIDENVRGDEKEEIIEEPVVKAVEPEIEEIKNPKLKALYSIITSREPENKTEVKMHINHLIEGKKDNPAGPEVPKKVLVFANYNETLSLIEEFLAGKDITYLRLGGTFQEMGRTVDKFKNSDIPVLLINSQHNCAGLNLQFANDLVMFHHIRDANILSQVTGRVQRIGRIYNSNIHFLLYNNESINVN